MAAARLYETAVEMFDETAVGGDGLAYKPCGGFCEFLDSDVGRFACKC